MSEFKKDFTQLLKLVGLSLLIEGGLPYNHESCASLVTILEQKLRKQVKPALHKEAAEFNPSDQMKMEQLIKNVLNLQEEIRKLRKENEKQTENIQYGLQDTLDLRKANQERDRCSLESLARAIQLNELSSEEDQNLEYLY